MIDHFDNTTKLRAFININDPEILITDAGTPKIDGNKIHIEALAHQVTFISPPSAKTQEFCYELYDLEPGDYTVTYAINERVEAELNLRIHGDGNPLPNLLSVRTGEDEDEWYGKVAVALSPGQQIVDWGRVRQTDGELHVNILIDALDHEGPVSVDPVPDKEIPHEIQQDPEGNHLVGNAPVRLVAHLFPFGKLTEGTYKFHVHSRGKLLTKMPFEVEVTPPQVVLITKNIGELKEFHRFKINFQSQTGLNITSIRSAKVWVTGPNNYREQATHENFSSSDDSPVSSANGTYSIRGPENHWDHSANGSYQISIETHKILDEEGNASNRSDLGEFQVQIIARAQSGTD
jgi:hypothetical protein